MEQYKIVYDALDQMGVAYQVAEHPPVMTAEEADRYIEGMPGVRTKTLFLCNKKGTEHYLVVLDDSKRVDMKQLAELLGEKGLRFASSQRLMDKLSLYPGAVSLFGLINNREKDVKVCLDREMLSEDQVTFHPNDNTRTLFLSTEDMLRFLRESGYEYRLIDL